MFAFRAISKNQDTTSTEVSGIPNDGNTYVTITDPSTGQESLVILSSGEYVIINN